MDYIVRDSSVLPDTHSFETFYDKDPSLRVGIVREELESPSGTRYVVEVLSGGKQVPVLCALMNRFGGAYNYEEYKVRSWMSGFPAGLLLPASAGKYGARSGDVVLVAYLDGKSREGVIIGGLFHPGRKKEKLAKGEIAYISEFNGIEKQIREDGTYKTTFKGQPVNLALLKIPPTGVDVIAPVYNPLISGSYYGFSNNGSFVTSDGNNQFIKIHKNLISGSVIIKSGNSELELGGNPILGNFSVKTGAVTLDAKTEVNVKSALKVQVQGLQVSIKGLKMAIGNDQFELFDGLVQLIDALGTLVVTSPVGTCTPLMAAPTWAQVLQLKIKIMLMKGSVQDAKSFSLSGDDSPDLGSDVGGGAG